MNVIIFGISIIFISFCLIYYLFVIRKEEKSFELDLTNSKEDRERFLNTSWDTIESAIFEENPNKRNFIGKDKPLLNSLDTSNYGIIKVFAFSNNKKILICKINNNIQNYDIINDLIVKWRERKNSMKILINK